MSQEGLAPVPQTLGTVTSLFRVSFYSVSQPALEVFHVLLQQQKLTQDNVSLYKTLQAMHSILLCMILTVTNT